MSKIHSAALTTAIKKELKNPEVSELKFVLSSLDGQEEFRFEAVPQNKPHFIASSTKMMVAAVFMKLIEEDRLTLEDRAVNYLPESTNMLMAEKFGSVFLNSITVRQLLGHTSRLMDYREAGELMKLENPSLDTQIHPGWTFSEMVTLSAAKGLATEGKTEYSGLNYQLLQQIAEHLTELPAGEILKKYVFRPAGMKRSSFYNFANLEEFDKASKLLVGTHEYLGAKRLASAGFEGSILSNLEDTQRFLIAFFNSRIFNLKDAEILKSWNKLFPGVSMGLGVMRVKLPIRKGMKIRVLEILGHSGMTGHQMFYVPKLNLVTSCTVNQIGKPQVGFRVFSRLLAAALL